MSSLIAICQVVLEKKICHQCIFVFRYFLLLEKGSWLFIMFFWINLNSLYLSGSGGKDFKILSMYFCYFSIISPLKRVWAFIWINLNPLYQRILCVNLVETGPVVLEEMKMWKVCRKKDRQTIDDGQQAIRKAHLSFQLW